MSFRPRFRRLVAGAAVAILAATGALAGAAQAQVRDTEIEAILRADLDPLIEAAGLVPADIRLLLINDKELNAFATTGRNLGMSSGSVIGINTGTILEAESPDQLAGVLAHEVGHVSAGHMARQGEMMRAGMRPFLLTMGLGIAAALAGSPEGAAALLASSSQFAAMDILKHSRAQEGSADQAAVRFLDKAGRSGSGLVEFFEKFRYQEVFSEARRYEYFRGHPLSAERINALRARVARQPNFDKKPSEQDLADHRLMQAKIDAFLNPPAHTFVKYKEKDASFPARYARAIAYYRASQATHALRAIDALLAEQPDNPYLHELKGQVLFENGKVADSEAPHRRSVELKPDAPLLRANLGRTLVALEDEKRVDEAVAELTRAVAAESDMYEAWRLLAQAYDRKGEPGRARLASAEAHFAVGDKKQAKVFAMRARDQLERNSPQRRRATDIVMASDPTDQDLKDVARDESRS